MRGSGLHQQDFRFHSLEVVFGVVLMLGHGRADLAEVLLILPFHVLTHLINHALRLVQELLNLRGGVPRLQAFDRIDIFL